VGTISRVGGGGGGGGLDTLKHGLRVLLRVIACAALRLGQGKDKVKAADEMDEEMSRGITVKGIARSACLYYGVLPPFLSGVIGGARLPLGLPDITLCADKMFSSFGCARSIKCIELQVGGGVHCIYTSPSYLYTKNRVSYAAAVFVLQQCDMNRGVR